MAMVSWKTRCKWNTILNADSVEWCPVAGYSDLLVCGTYQLEMDHEEKLSIAQKRLGRIYLFQIEDKASDNITPIQTIDTSGILDQKWCYHTINDLPILATVTSDGCLKLYKLEKKDAFILSLWMECCIGEHILALSLDWSSNKFNTQEPKIVVSDSTGRIIVFSVGDTLVKIGEWKFHSYEAWIGAFNYWDSNVFYSGGDDCLFKSYDIRNVESAVTTNRSHEAGVTAVRSDLNVEHHLLTGSYDEKVRLWDTRNLKRAVTETNVNGGVWRLKFHPYKSSYILAACMYGGFRTLKLAGDISVEAEYLEHESIAYGADWMFDETKSVVATCSFYDCMMHIADITI